MTSSVRAAGLILTAGALLALPLLSADPALARHHKHAKAHGSQDKVDSSAYPNSPGGTPATGDKGKPVETKGDAGAKPSPPGKAGTDGTSASPGTNSTAYPGAPNSSPAAGNNGKPVK